MHLVDSHCHVSDRWYEPVETLLFQMHRHGVAQAVLVQLLGQHDNGYQQACVRRHPDRFASVVAVDVDAADACEQLHALAGEGATGLRLRPQTRSPGGDPLAIWRCAEALGLAVSCVGNPATFRDPAFVELTACVPRLAIVLEHLGGTSTPDLDAQASAARIAVFEALADRPNVSLKLPGMGELCPRAAGWAAAATPFGPGLPETLTEALRHFGPGRLTWGSDFPPVAAREGYGLALEACRQSLASLSDAERAQIFGGNARRLFRLAGP